MHMPALFAAIGYAKLRRIASRLAPHSGARRFSSGAQVSAQRYPQPTLPQLALPRFKVPPMLLASTLLTLTTVSLSPTPSSAQTPSSTQTPSEPTPEPAPAQPTPAQPTQTPPTQTPPTPPDTPKAEPAQPAPPPSGPSSRPSTLRLTSLANGQVALHIPLGFAALTPAQITELFNGPAPPKYVYANRDRSALIAINLTQQPLSAEDLPELLTQMKQLMAEGVPGLEWINQKDWIELANQRWASLEFRSTGQNGPLHNDLYFTAFQGKQLILNFVSIPAQGPKLRPLLLRSRDSLQLKPQALGSTPPPSVKGDPRKAGQL